MPVGLTVAGLKGEAHGFGICELLLVKLRAVGFVLVELRAV